MDFGNQNHEINKIKQIMKSVKRIIQLRCCIFIFIYFIFKNHEQVSTLFILCFFLLDSDSDSRPLRLFSLFSAPKAVRKSLTNRMC